MIRINHKKLIAFMMTIVTLAGNCQISYAEEIKEDINILESVSGNDISSVSGNEISDDIANIPEDTDVLEKENYLVNYKVKLLYGETDSIFGTVSKQEETATLNDNGEYVFEGCTAEAIEGFMFDYWTDEEGNVISKEKTFIPSELKETATYTATFKKIFIDQEIEKDIEGLNIKVKGQMPEGIILNTKILNDIEKTKELVENEVDGKDVLTVKISKSIDIELLYSDGTPWQPVDDGKNVNITISGLEIEEKNDTSVESEISVYRIEDDNSTVTDMNADIDREEGTVNFDTNHFTEYTVTINSKTYTYSEDTTWQNDWHYYISGEYIEISYYDGKSTDIVIPTFAVIDGKAYQVILGGNMTSLAVNYGDITSVTIEDDVIIDQASTLFYGFSNLKTVNMEGADCSKEDNAYGMFSGCYNIENITLPLRWGKITDTSSMFNSCYKLKNIYNLDKLDTSNVEEMDHMFSGCRLFETLDLSFFNTSSLKSIQYMFQECTNLRELKLFKAEHLENVFGAFSLCSNLKELDLSPFNLSNITSSYNLDLSIEKNIEKLVAPTGMLNGKLYLNGEMGIENADSIFIEERTTYLDSGVDYTGKTFVRGFTLEFIKRKSYANTEQVTSYVVKKGSDASGVEEGVWVDDTLVNEVTLTNITENTRVYQIIPEYKVSLPAVIEMEENNYYHRNQFYGELRIDCYKSMPINKKLKISLKPKPFVNTENPNYTAKSYVCNYYNEGEKVSSDSEEPYSELFDGTSITHYYEYFCKQEDIKMGGSYNGGIDISFEIVDVNS
ncbi:MAG: DUF285 domain-containing protein [Butyrivibrio sp.]|nr:DUF285 domain-containing protein [Butyrivibrio sp.]